MEQNHCGYALALNIPPKKNAFHMFGTEHCVLYISGESVRLNDNLFLSSFSTYSSSILGQAVFC